MTDKEKKKVIKIAKMLIAVNVILLVPLGIIITNRNNEILKQIKEESNSRFDKIQLTEEQTGAVIEMVLENVSEMQDDLERVQRTVSRLVESRRDEEILRVLFEKYFSEYTKEGLDYFDDRNYLSAAIAFEIALRYKPNNTTVLFYQTYASYLYFIHAGREITESEMAGIRAKIKRLQGGVFKEEEGLGLTMEMMEIRIKEMAEDISKS